VFHKHHSVFAITDTDAVFSDRQNPKWQKELLARAVFNASAGNRTRGWPMLSEEDLLMATANFTTKPPMLDDVAVPVNIM